MKTFIYLLSGILFGIGLSLSGMIDPLKVQQFLSVGFADWSPALIFVLGSAAPVYLISFLYLRRRQRTLNGAEFKLPAVRPIDRRLVLGAVIFGVGWGIAGICPGPALVHVAFLDANFAIFIATMIAGFEIHRSFA